MAKPGRRNIDRYTATGNPAMAGFLFGDASGHDTMPARRRHAPGIGDSSTKSPMPTPGASIGSIGAAKKEKRRVSGAFLIYPGFSA
ncbi:hypothetical protein KDH83_02545 [Achromobacter sp. Marseille-Q0513]|uniref:hypothetical protein n=1 Tax=Achromobacter sp. Marseille-Q0513 TaxID=2829161 RepID=UPI001B9379ED|nr:hypothetical protein [Achromobacter sp. Marseille-Q0513]MBR8652183.1 hypothetical protein [Achromobacter sp. Marseille-Q0513]